MSDDVHATDVVPYLHPDDGHTLECAARPNGAWVCDRSCPHKPPVSPASTEGAR